MNTKLGLGVAVLGSTGAGKTELALAIAERFKGEILNCDSVQVYRDLEIGTAKLPFGERRGIPHHLLDVISVDEELTAGAYSRLARKTLGEIRERGHLAVIVGGTGFYLRALLDGLSPAPARDEVLRARLDGLARRRPRALHRFLSLRDRVAAAKIHPNDHQKLIRAIELTLLAGQPASQTQSQPRDALQGFAIFKVGLAPERAQLYRRIDERASLMFRSGLLEETKALLEGGYSPSLKALQSLGYKQAIAVLTKNMPLAEAILECQTRIRQYAKRQMTWFRADPAIEWLHGFGSDESIQRQAVELVEDFIEGAWGRAGEACLAPTGVGRQQ